MKPLVLAIAVVLVELGNISALARGGGDGSSFTMTLEQEGSDVVATGDGTISLTGISFTGPDNVASLIDSSGATLSTGPVAPTDDTYTGFSGPTSFGSGGLIFASTNTGDSVGINGSAPDIFVPSGYVSGSELSGSATWDNYNLADLGATPGTYVWTWGTDVENSYTIDIVAVPEPSAWALLLASLSALVFLYRRRLHHSLRCAID